MEHLGWGLQMTVLGMGLVFSLLALLWGLLTVVLMFDKVEGEPEASADDDDDGEEAYAAEEEEAAPAGNFINGMPADMFAAMSVAVIKHALDLRRQAAPIVCVSAPDGGAEASRWLAGGRARQNNSWQPKGR